ncbi:MAG: ferric reductase-like transmembrane domain-containing protein [Patescibacteria group bacterium]
MKKLFLFILCVLVFGLLLFFWFQKSGALLFGDIRQVVLSLGRLAGLLAAFASLFQLVLIGRVKWVESLFGLDKLFRIHHINGVATLFFVFLHPFFITTAYKGFSEVSYIEQTKLFLFNWSDMLQAYAAFLIFIFLIVISFSLIKKKLKYEWWYVMHLGMYVAIALAFGHQIENGGDFQNNTPFVVYWYVLYIFVFGNLLFYRFFTPLYNFWKHRFFVDRVVHENNECVSIYISGKHMEKFHLDPGQFFIFRFLHKNFFFDAHPYSLSVAPNGTFIRITVKSLGDFSEKISRIPIGTPVLIDGPHGIFTHKVSEEKKVLHIAGGIGITPIRSLIEYFSGKKDEVLLWGNREEKDIIFKEELNSFLKDGFRVYHVLSNDEKWNGEKGFIDKEKILRLVPDVKERDIYLCGPSPMMKGVLDALKEIGIPRRRVHYERFSF